MLAIALTLLIAAQAHAPLNTGAGPEVEALVDVHDVKGLKATFFVAAAPDDVLATLWDVKRFQSIFPDIKSLEVLAIRGETSIDARFSVDAVLAKVSYTLRRELDRTARRVSWQSIGGDLKSVRGSWTVVPTSDAGISQVIYTSFVDVGYVVPTSMVRDVAMGKVSEMVGRVRAACAKKA